MRSLHGVVRVLRFACISGVLVEQDNAAVMDSRYDVRRNRRGMDGVSDLAAHIRADQR
jgi:hypothetical protein